MASFPPFTPFDVSPAPCALGWYWKSSFSSICSRQKLNRMRFEMLRKGKNNKIYGEKGGRRRETIPGSADGTKQNPFSRHGLNINTAERSTGMLMTVARHLFRPCNIWAVCLSYTEPDQHSEVAWCFIRWPHQNVFMSMCDGEEYQSQLRKRRMVNASFAPGIPILMAWCKDGTFPSPSKGRGFNKCLMVKNTVARTVFKLCEVKCLHHLP